MEPGLQSKFKRIGLIVASLLVVAFLGVTGLTAWVYYTSPEFYARSIEGKNWTVISAEWVKQHGPQSVEKATLQDRRGRPYITHYMYYSGSQGPIHSDVMGVGVRVRDGLVIKTELIHS